MKSTINKPKTATEFDEYFEDNDIADLLEIKPKRVNIDIPPLFLNKLDYKAKSLGVSRQSLIKIWLAEKLGMA